MRQRLLSAARLPFFASYADAAAWVADRAAAIAAVLDRSTGRRLDALGLVAGSVEHFRPQSRYGGGYGVVGSVLGPQAVELAAGYTLSEAGACRLWDKSEGEHLDEGGLEFSRVGSTCYLPSTTGLAAGDVIYSAEPVFHDWAELNAMLTAAGSGFDVLGELRNRSSKGLIGGWRWRDGAIRPDGGIDFTRVTASQGATIGSVTGQVLDLSDSTFVVDGGYTLRIRNVTDGANVTDVAAGSWTRSGAGIDAGAAVAAAVAALIAGGKSIRCWVEGLSELSIGGASSAIELGAGGILAFDSGAVFPTQTALNKLNAIGGAWRGLNWEQSGLTVGATEADRFALGRTNGATYSRFGWGRHDGSVNLVSNRNILVLYGSVIADPAAQIRADLQYDPLYNLQVVQPAILGGAAPSAARNSAPVDVEMIASAITITSISARYA